MKLGLPGVEIGALTPSVFGFPAAEIRGGSTIQRSGTQTNVDSAFEQAGTNPGFLAEHPAYGSPIAYQRPIMARLGFEVFLVKGAPAVTS